MALTLFGRGTDWSSLESQAPQIESAMNSPQVPEGGRIVLQLKIKTFSALNLVNYNPAGLLATIINDGFPVIDEYVYLRTGEHIRRYNNTPFAIGDPSTGTLTLTWAKGQSLLSVIVTALGAIALSSGLVVLGSRVLGTLPQSVVAAFGILVTSIIAGGLIFVALVEGWAAEAATGAGTAVTSAFSAPVFALVLGFAAYNILLSRGTVAQTLLAQPVQKPKRK